MPPGLNTSGLPDPGSYTLGRGKLFFAQNVNSLPGAYRDLGNATEFTYTVEAEKIEHQSSREVNKTVDKTVPGLKKVSLAFTLDEINFQNIAAFVSGSTATHVNPAKSAQTEFNLVSAVELGRWYDIRVPVTNARAYRFTATNAIKLQKTGSAIDLVAGTDYILDAEFGRVFIPATGGTLIAGDGLDVAWSADPANKDISEVRGLVSASLQGAILLDSINAADGGARTAYQFHKVTLEGQGDASLIGDEFMTMQFTGSVESNAIASPESPFMSVRAVPA